MRERLLTNHFLQRFVDNDLISPRADRHQVLSICGAALVSTGLVVTLFLSLKFMMVSFQTPGQTAVTALGDRLFFIGASWLVMGLVAVAVWNGISLDDRDTAVLGPLPIPFWIIVRAKTKAVIILAVLAAACLNLAPSLLYPVLMSNSLPIGPAGIAELVLAQLMVTAAAGVFGFLTVVAIREILRLVSGPTLFARISAVLQAVLVFLLGGMLLVLPDLMSQATTWLSNDRAYVIPPMWFLSVHERLFGHVIAGLPRPAYPEHVAELESAATAAYQSYQPAFRALARAGWISLATALLVAAASYTWNNRKPSAPGSVPRRGRRRFGGAPSRVATWLLVRTPAARAGFFFALRALWRSAPHRLALATSLGAGLAIALVLMSKLAFEPVADVTLSPLGLFGAQVVLIAFAALGFHHAVRLPAELRANWMLHMCWRGNERSYLSGVRLAGLLTLVCPILVVLLPLGAESLGWRLALTHAAFGFLLASLLFELTLFQFRKWPFASSYVPDDRLKSMASIYILAFVAVAYSLAWIERQALSSVLASATLLGILLLSWIGLRLRDAYQRRHNTLSLEIPEEAQVGLRVAEW